jgi:uncharacterized membrane protein
MSKNVPNPAPHIRWLYQQLPEWRKKGWLTEETENAIREQYGPATIADPRRLTSILFATLATLLIGGGIILLFAYNWENFSRPLRAALAIAPLLATYAISYFTLTRRKESTAWNEGSAVGNTCALAATIALVGQTYNIPGSLPGFLLTVSLLSLPLLYLHRSSGAALLYLLGITIWRWETPGFVHNTTGHDYLLYWLLLALLLPLIYHHHRSGRTTLTRALLTTTLAAAAIALPAPGMEEWGFLTAYALAASGIVALRALDERNALIHPVLSTGAHGVLFVLLLIISFTDTWKASNFHGNYATGTIVLVTLLAAGNALLIARLATKHTPPVTLAWASAGLAILALRLTTTNLEPEFLIAVMANLAGLALGAITIATGYRQNKMRLVNGGLALIGGILFMRFQDADISLIVRGCGLIAIGIAILATNVYLSRKMRKGKAL